MSVSDEEDDDWCTVRCVFLLGGQDELVDGGRFYYEERLTLWRVAELDEAIREAEVEAKEYAEDIGARFLGLAQAFRVRGRLKSGQEVYSLIRASGLEENAYVSRYFDTGHECEVATDDS